MAASRLDRRATIIRRQRLFGHGGGNGQGGGGHGQGGQGGQTVQASQGLQTAAAAADPIASDPLGIGGILSSVGGVVNTVLSPILSPTQAPPTTSANPAPAPSSDPTTVTAAPATSAAPTQGTAGHRGQSVTSVFVTSSGGQAVTVTQLLPASTSETSPASTSTHADPKPFLQNKPLEGVVFGLAGVVALAFIIIISTMAIRRSRMNRLNKDLDEAAILPPIVHNNYDGDDEDRTMTMTSNNSVHSQGREAHQYRRSSTHGSDESFDSAEKHAATHGGYSTLSPVSLSTAQQQLPYVRPPPPAAGLRLDTQYMAPPSPGRDGVSPPVYQSPLAMSPVKSLLNSPNSTVTNPESRSNTSHSHKLDAMLPPVPLTVAPFLPLTFGEAEEKKNSGQRTLPTRNGTSDETDFSQTRTLKVTNE